MDNPFNAATHRILDSIREPFVFLDRRMHYVYANDAAVGLLGRTRDELLNRYVWDVFPEAPVLFREPFARAMEMGEAIHVTGLNPRRGAWYDCHYYPSDEGLAILFRDVTEKYGVETALSESEARFRTLAEASRVLSASLDYEETLRRVADLMVPCLADWCAVDVFDDEGRLQRVTVTHVDPERVREVVEASKLFPTDPQRPHGLARAAHTGAPVLVPHVTDELLYANADNEAQLAALRRIGFRSLLVVPLRTREVPLGAIMMVWAETERHYTEADLRFAEELAARAAVAIENARLYREARTAEAELRTLAALLEARVLDRTRALERRNQELQDFAHMASHDLQEPLRKFHTFLDLLKTQLDAPGPDVEDSIRRMESSATRMSELISGLLALSRVATQAATFRPTALNGVVEGVLSDLEVSIAEAAARVEVGALGTVQADPLQMRQLFQNLIGNAVKFRRRDGDPVVRIRSEDIALRREDGVPGVPACRILVEDNGLGFDERYLDRIFQPFQRLHGRSKYPGSGIGLAICRRIVERHGGTLDARSVPGEGSTFVITLPARHEPAAPDAAAPARTPAPAAPLTA